MFARTAIALFLGLSAVSAEVSFNQDIRPLLSNTCYRCHGPDEENRKGKLRLDTREGAIADRKGTHAIVPGDLDASELIYRITTDDVDDVMPPPKAGKRFTAEEVALMKQWVAEGAKYETHWSYQKPVRPKVPSLWGDLKLSGKNEVDAFLLKRLAEEGLRPAPAADPHVLIRRVSLDLTGLPPTAEEVGEFVNDKSPDAYAKLIDRLLAQPAFGEHWARMWLDLARYADSAGYADDPPRVIWGYRDWVIRAFNDNMPFDQFTIEQLAGDQLENPTTDQLVATGFHRNTQTNNEGGTNDEEYRNVAVVDRVNTTMATWMGTTMACAQCHTHKYDPITHEEYFKMFAILNQSEDADRRNESPTVPVFTAEQRTREGEIKARILELEKSLAAPNAENLKALAKWEAGLKDASTHWMALKVAGKASSGATLKSLEDGSLLVSGKSAKTDTYSLQGLTYSKAVTAVRIDVLSDDRLGDKGPGRKGNFVLNEIDLVAGAESKSKRGKFVRIDLPGKNKIINIAEVQVFSGSENIALKGKATQAGQYAEAGAARAIDGKTDGDYNKGSVAHTAVDKDNPFWEVDLGKVQDISRIVVWNRTDGTVQNRLDGFKLSLLDINRGTVWTETYKTAPKRELEASLDGGQRAVFVRATSSYDQEKFAAALAIDGNAGKDSGWAIGGETGRDHHAVFELASPLAPPGGGLQFTLKQNYPDHAIGRLRISVANTPGPHRALPHAIADILSVPKAKRTPEQTATLLDFFREINPATAKASAELAQLKKALTDLKPATTVPILRDLAAGKGRKTHIQLRGSYLAKGDEVTPGLPAAFMQGDEGETMNRMTLAKWLVDGDNPLTARVTANRLWEKIFGIGIVPTSEEFGSQGERPTHPELLNWLAVEFVESGWDVKAFLKLLVMSEAYRQDSKLSDALAERDPDNRLLARGPRFRLSAEMVRDQALAVSGLLSSKMYGAPVRPPQPNLGIKAAFGGGIDWKTSDGEDKFRRGLYTTWRRSNPYPSMAAFDAPNREVCTVRRDRTNTPLQALVTLNDPVYVEAAQSLARRMYAAATKGKSTQAGIERGFQLCLSRPGKPVEITRLVELFKSAHAQYKKDPAMAKSMATEPIGAAPEGADHAQLAALAIVGNVLLNLDEFLMKR